jgi:hypothetical protein
VSNKRLSHFVLAVVAAEVLFWGYTFIYIGRHANPRGDGMEWMAEVPMTMIVLFGVVPAVLLAIAGLWFRWLGIAGALFAAGALVADVVIWTEILGEFAH